MSVERIRALAKNNEEYAKTHEPSIPFADFPNSKGVLVLACLDPRCSPNAFWNFGEKGPGIIRNAGGRASDALRSMRVISAIMANGRNTLGAVAVVHHNDCVMMPFDHDFIAGKLKERVGTEGDLAKEVDGMDFGEFKNLEASIREDIAIIKADPFLPKDLEVVGFVHDVFTGKVTEISAE